MPKGVLCTRELIWSVYIFLKAYTSTFSQLLENVFVEMGIVSFVVKTRIQS